MSFKHNSFDKSNTEYILLITEYMDIPFGESPIHHTYFKVLIIFVSRQFWPVVWEITSETPNMFYSQLYLFCLFIGHNLALPKKVGIFYQPLVFNSLRNAVAGISFEIYLRILAKTKFIMTNILVITSVS